MTLLLDIDGVMVTTPSWQRPELSADGFMKFNEHAVANLALLLEATAASVVLSTTHRVNFDLETWKQLFASRGLEPVSIAKINARVTLDPKITRAGEVLDWINNPRSDKHYVIIDDDSSLHALPQAVKDRWVKQTAWPVLIMPASKARYRYCCPVFKDRPAADEAQYALPLPAPTKHKSSTTMPQYLLLS